MKTKAKPKKPYPDFPLFLHQTGQWAKKVRGRMHYFGTEPDAALTKYLEQRDDLQAGRTPRTRADELTVRDLANRFLTSKKALLDSDELSPRTWSHSYTTCENIVSEFGKTRTVADITSEDFEKLRTSLAKTRKAHAHIRNHKIRKSHHLTGRRFPQIATPSMITVSWRDCWTDTSSAAGITGTVRGAAVRRLHHVETARRHPAKFGVEVRCVRDVGRRIHAC